MNTNKLSDDIKEQILLFKEYSIKRWEYLEKGNSQLSNKYYDKLKNIEKNLNDDDHIDALSCFLEDKNNFVRFEIAVVLLKHDNEQAHYVLNEMATFKGLIGFTAKMTIQEWDKNRKQGTVLCLLRRRQ